ncbi:hypothetical protein KAJ27_20370 [bacterium]|nr:hypothetical protein [bacterium]
MNMNKLLIIIIMLSLTVSGLAQNSKNMAVFVKPVSGNSETSTPNKTELRNVKNIIMEKLMNASSNLFFIDESVFEELQRNIMMKVDELTSDDIFNIGQIRNADYSLIAEYSKSGAIRVQHNITFKLVDTDQGHIYFHATEEGNDLTAIIESLIKRTIDRIFNLTLQYKINSKPDKLLINGELYQSGLVNSFSMPAGKVDIHIEKVGFRSIDTLIAGEAGSKHELNFTLLEKGAAVKIKGSPLDAKFTLVGKEKLNFKKPSFSTYLTEGPWTLYMKRKGFKSEEFVLNIVDGEDLIKKYVLETANRKSAIRKNLLFSGWGQHSMGYHGRGILYNTMSIASLAAGVWFSYDYISMRSDYVELDNQRKIAIGEEADRINQLIPDIEDVNIRGTIAAASWGCFTLNYTWSIFEVIKLDKQNKKLLGI